MYRGKVHKVGKNIDTDAIIPARFLVTTDTAELGSHCMEGLEANWVSRVKDGDIIVADENFGCGSSREHAPLAILGAGIPVVVAESFARIFYRNSFNMGLTLMELGAAVSEINDGDELEIDPASGLIKNLSSGKSYQCQPVPASMEKILENGGLVGYVKHRLQAQ